MCKWQPLHRWSDVPLIGLYFSIALFDRSSASWQQAPIVLATASEWILKGQWGVKKFPKNPIPSLLPIVDKITRRIILPLDETVVGLDFGGEKKWSVGLASCYDPRPMLKIGNLVLLGINWSVWNRNVSRSHGEEVAANFRDPKTLCVRITDGHLEWQKSEFSMGSVLGSLDDKTFFAVRISNIFQYFTGRSKEHLEFDLRSASSGRLLRSWKLLKVPESLIGPWGDAPGQANDTWCKVVKTGRDCQIVFAPASRDFGSDFSGRIILGRNSRRPTIEKLSTLMQPYVEAMKRKDYTSALKAVDAIEAKMPEQMGELVLTRFKLMGLANRPELKGYAKKLTAAQSKENYVLLNSMAWSILDPASKMPNPPYDVALILAKQAATASQMKNPEVLDTYALALYKMRDKEQALQIQIQAVQLMKASKASDPATLKQLEGRLEMYKQACASINQL